MPIRFCAKSLTVADDINNRKAEMESVNARVTKTKQEIEELKNQLQELISDGIKKSDFSATKQNVAALNNDYKNVTETQLNVDQPNVKEAETLKDSIAGIIGNVNEETGKVFKASNSSILLREKSNSKPKIEETPKKVRNYDREAARKYIEKQRQKRKQLMAQKTDSKVLEDMKKQRLEELHRKSLELISKNIKIKKKAPKVKEKTVDSNKTNLQNVLANENIPTDVAKSHLSNIIETNSKQKFPASQKNFPPGSNPELKHITIRSPHNNDLSAIILKELPKHKDTYEKQNKAATKIQAVFRGYRQRKKFQMMLNRRRNLESRRTKLISVKEVQTNAIEQNIPSWLQTSTVVPSSYNFITAVKHKLNLAVQQISSYKNETTSFKSQHAQTSNQNEITNENDDLKSFLSHKCLSFDKKTVEPIKLTNKLLKLKLQEKSNLTRNEPTAQSLKSVRNEDGDDSDTSNNIPEISSEATSNPFKNQQSSKRSHSDVEDNRPPINTDKFKKLKLRLSHNLDFNVENEKLEPENLKFSGRDSIIAYNKCDYSESEPTKISVSKNNNFNSRQSKQIASESLTKIRSHQDNLTSSQSNINEEIKSSEQIVETATTSQSTDKQKNKIQSYNESEPKSDTHSWIKTNSQRDEQKNKIKSSSLSEIKSGSQSWIKMNSQPEYSNTFVNGISTASLPSLKRPTVSLRSSLISLDDDNLEVIPQDHDVTNVNLKIGEKTKIHTKLQSKNEIHLKFEAELHLLNDFNNSLRQFMEVEKSLLDLHASSNNPGNKETTYYTRDTQTSVVTKSSSDTKLTSNVQSSDKNIPSIPTINYSRGSKISDQIDIFGANNSISGVNDISLFGTSLDLSQFKDSVLASSFEKSKSNINISIVGESFNGNGNKEVPLEMFDQLIHDEDIRIENLKTILKIREKALVDRTKGELAWLEIQKKNLRDSGQLQQISAIKKKQRGLLIKLEHERHEMQRLKQLQKAASRKRKLALKDKRNMIKTQLSTNNVITKIKRRTREEKRHVGPLKVYNIKSHSESVLSETSFSRKSSVSEVVSVVSQSRSIVSNITEEEQRIENIPQQRNVMPPLFLSSQIEAEDVKRSLLMREEALQKRRKAAEELLQWHQRLVEEEKKIAELELAANAIVNPPAITNTDKPRDEKHKFKGSHLNLLWKNMTGREENKFNDKLNYTMSKLSLEQFCKDAKKFVNSRTKSLNKKSENNSFVDDLKSNSAVSSDNKEKIHSRDKKGPISRVETNRDVTDYTSDFDSTFSDELTRSKTSGITDRESELEQNVITDEVITEIIDDKSSTLDIRASSHNDEAQNTEISSECQTEIGSNDNLLCSEEIATEKQISSLVNREKEESAISSEYETKMNSNSVKGSSLQDVLTEEKSSNSDIKLEQSEILSEYPTTDMISPKGSTDNEILTEEQNTNLDLNHDGWKSISENTTTEIISKQNSSSSAEDILTQNLKSSSELNTNKQTSATYLEHEIDERTSKSSLSHLNEINTEDRNSSLELNDDQKQSEIISEYSTNKSVASDKEMTIQFEGATESYNSKSELSVDDKNNSAIVDDEASSKIQSQSRVSSISELKVSIDKSEIIANDQVSTKIETESDKEDKNSIYEFRKHEQTSSVMSEYEVSEDSSSHTSSNQNEIVEEQKFIVNDDSNEYKDDEIFEEQKSILDDDSNEYKDDEVVEEQKSILDDDSNEYKDDEVVEEQKSILDDDSNEYKDDEVVEEQKSGLDDHSNEFADEISTEQKSSVNVDSNEFKDNEIVVEQKSSVDVDSNELKDDEIVEEQKSNVDYDLNEYNDELSSKNQNLTISESLKIGSVDGIALSNQDDFEKHSLRLEIGAGDVLKSLLVQEDKSEVFSEYDTENDVSQDILAETKLTENEEKSEQIVPKSNTSASQWETTKSSSQIGEENRCKKDITSDAEVIVSVPKEKSVLISNIEVKEKSKEASHIREDDPQIIKEDLSVNSDQEVSINENSSLHDIESLEKSESVGDIEEDKLNYKDEVQNLDFDVNDSDELDNIYPVHKNEFQLDEIESEETSSNEKTDSRLLLSYGYVERKSDRNTESNEENSNTLEISDREKILNEKSKSSENISNDDEKSHKESIEAIQLNDSDNDDNNVVPPVIHIDIKKRVSEILADANIASPRGDRSPRLQDLYVTAYDVISPEHSPEPDSPVDDVEPSFSSPKRVYGNDEVEELLKKQLAIEQEIKQIQQQQQEHLPYLYVREIPNKPPPPYKPPLISQAPSSDCILPDSDNYINIITSLATDIIYDAYCNNKTENITLTEEQKVIIQTKHKIEESCIEFVFDLCKEAALLYYKQFETDTGPSWMYLRKKTKLATSNSQDKSSLEAFVDKNVKEWLGYEFTKVVENVNHKWSSKKRDHVDELLVVECQAEESDWTNYDRDELIVKDELTKNIMDMLIEESAQLLNNILTKKKI